MTRTDDPETRLQTLINQLSLPTRQADVLRVLALDDCGLALVAAPSILSSALNCSVDECSEQLTELIGSGLVLKVMVGGHSRVVANYAKLNVSEELRQVLRSLHPSPFEVLDAPHSAEAMATLHSLFLEEKDPIYVGLDITSPRVFQNLTQRAASGFMTVFIMPERKLISSDRLVHYDETVRAWVQFIKDLPRRSRGAIELRTTKVPYRYLYTSALARTFARFNCYRYGEKSTRRGVMIKVQSGSSLYEIVLREYAQAMEHSLPMFTLWPGEWLKLSCARFAPVIVTAVLLVIAFVLDNELSRSFPLAKYLAAFLAGLAGELLWELYRTRRRIPRALYES